MSDEVQIVEDGVPGVPAADRPRPSWILGVVGFVVGLGIGVLVVGPSPAGEPGLGAPGQVPVPTTTLPEMESLGAADVIPGFPDAIVAVARTPTSAMEHLLWPVRGELRVRAMTGGESVRLDAGSQFIAVTETIPGLDGVVLSMGRFNSIRGFTSGTLGHAWHDSTEGWLAYTAPGSAGTDVFTVKADLRPVPFMSLEVDSATPIGWGDWGWAFQVGDEILLLTADGRFKDTETGLGLDTDPRGWVFVVEGSTLKLVSAGGGVSTFPNDAQVGTVAAARFAPDGRHIVVGGSRGLSVIDTADGDVTKLTEFWSPNLAWSSDSRFVLVGTSSGLNVYDVSTAEVMPVLRQHSLVAVGVVPLSSS